jgi:hypothetical protein
MGHTEAIEAQIVGLQRERQRWAYALPEDEESVRPVFSALRAGETFSVAEPICRLIGTAADSLPTATLVRELLPAAGGWVYFDRPFPMSEFTSDGYHPLLQALSWTTFRDGIVVGVFMTRPQDGKPWPILHMNYPWLFGANVREVATEVPTPEPIPGFTEYSCYLMALLLFMRQRILVASARYIANRQARKRIAKAIGHEPVVKVIELRARDYQQRDESEGTGMEYTCQWLVRGHWHQYHTREGLQPRWVMPYVKGPSDKPLRVAEKVAYEVVR